MFKRFVFAAILAGAIFGANAFAFEFPAPSGYVNDFAGVIPAEDKAGIEQALAAFEKQTSTEIVVAIVSSFEGADRFTYSQELFNAWGLGKEGRNNGILFLIGPSGDAPFPEHGEAFINVGRGLEGALPDSLTGTILRREVFPRFKERDFTGGVEAGVSAIMQAVKGEYTAETERGSGSVFDSGLGVFVVWLGFLFISWIASFLGRSKSWWLGGVLGGAGGAAIGFIFFTGIVILISAFAIGGLGLLFDFIVSRNFEYRRKNGLPTDFWHSGGGFWFGGGRGGFGGGGGFSGFGGGSSFGGGAGGRW